MSTRNISKVAAYVHSRFVDLSLSSEFAMSRLGIKQDDSNTAGTRSLLDIEAKAIKLKEKKKATEQEFRVYVNEYLHEHLFAYIAEKIEDKEYIFNELITIEPEIGKIFDACAAPATGVKQLVPLVEALPWLKANFIHRINKAPFRDETSPKTAVEKVDLGIRYIGIENTKFLLLSEIGKRWLPHSTEPFSEFKQSAWVYSISSANCMRALSPLYKVAPETAFMFGLLHGIGASLMLRLYLRAYNTVRVQQMRETSKAGRKDIEKVLDTLEIDPAFVSQALIEFGWQLTASVFEHLGLKFAVVLPAAEDFVNKTPFADCVPMAQALHQANTFAQYKILQKHRLIELDEAKAFLTNVRINNTVIGELNKVNLTKIKFSV